VYELSLSLSTCVALHQLTQALAYADDSHHCGHRYTPVVHALNIRQAAQIISMHKDTTSNTNDNNNNSSIGSETDTGIKSGERAVCRFRFMHYAEFIQPGTTIVLREGRTRGFGRVTAVH
jgi:GTPase